MSTTPNVEEVKIITTEEAIAAAESYRVSARNVEKIESDIKFEQSKVGAKHKKALDMHTEMRDKAKETLELFVTQNRDDLLGEKKSINYAGIKVGFRLAATKLVLKGKNTWDKVKDKLRGNAQYVDYLVLKEDVDVNRLKKAEADVLKDLGVELTQEESFYVKV